MKELYMFSLDYYKKYSHSDNEAERLKRKLNFIIERLEQMSVEFDNLQAQVTKNSEVLDSAITLINGIADRITAAGVDPVKLNALTTELKAKDDLLASAVVANTPSV